MAGVLHRKLLRELRSSVWLLMVIVSIMAVGISCFAGMTTLHRNLSQALARYYAQSRMADFSIEVKKAPLTEIDALRELPGVGDIRPRIQFFATVDLEGADRLLNGLVLSLPDRREPVINDIVVRRGHYFTERRQNEVIVNESFAQHHRLQPGQWIHLLMNNRRQELFIVGTAISSEFTYLVGPGAITPDPEHFGVFYLKRSFAEEVFDFDGAANQVLGRLALDAGGQHPAEGSTTVVPTATREVLRRAEQMLEPYGVASTTALADQASNRFISSEIGQLRIFAFIMPAIFLAVVVLVLNVLLTRMVEQQRTVTGTLKAMGYTDLRLFGHFLEYAGIVGIAGGLAGCALGYWLAEGMTIIYRRFYQFPELNNTFYLDIHLTALAIGIGCAVVGCLRGSRAVLRLQPAEAMRAKPPVHGHAILLERINWLWRRLSSSWRMVLRDLFRTRTRTIAGVFAAAMGASVLVMTFMMAEGVVMLIDFQFRWILRSDLDLTLKDEHGRDALAEARRLPGVDWAEPQFVVPGTFVNGSYRKKSSLTGLADGARLTIPRDTHARAIPVPLRGIAMTRTLADILQVERGDMVRFEPTIGERRPFELPVLEIADSYLGIAAYTNLEHLSHLMNEEFALNGIQLATDGLPKHTAALHRELRQLPAIQGVSARSDMIRNLEDTIIRNLWVSLGLLIVFAGLVFFGSILNSSLVSLAERQREIATLRVLGYSPWQVGSLLLRESLIVTAIGTLLGMPLGYMLTVFSVNHQANELFRVPVVASLGTWALTLVLAVVFALLAHLAVQRAIHRMDWLDALKAKE
ncbi:MAG: ABC transporter permease [Planctomycetota bacterium]